MELLREDLLSGRRVALAGTVVEAVVETLRARSAELELVAASDLPDDEERLGEWARSRAPLHALVYCAGSDQRTDPVWAAVREVAVGALIPAGAAGKIVLVGPAPDRERRAAVMCAALENLARTLSVEWARYGLTAVMIAPGARTTSQQLAELVCFVVSEAGEYLSGCRLELGALP